MNNIYYMNDLCVLISEDGCVQASMCVIHVFSYLNGDMYTPWDICVEIIGPPWAYVFTF